MPTRDQFQRPLRDLRISVTDKCNFRCPYCMPADIFNEHYEFAPKSTVLTYEEIVRLAQLFVQAGVEKIRLTGGEPLLRRDITTLIRQLRGIEGLHDLTLTTNGWFLAGQAAALREAGLNRVTVSLDSLDEGTFKAMNGRGYGLARVLEGIDAALAAGLTPLKVNAVVQRGVNDAGVVDLAAFARERGVIVRFIEFMDVGNLNNWRLEQVVPSAEVLRRIHSRFPLEAVESNYRGEVAQRYRFVDGQGEIGVISSVSQPFCGDCTRGRLSTDGQLVTCLFATAGHNLRDPMRAGASDAALLAQIEQVWGARTDRYSEERSAVTPGARKKVEMFAIGG